MEQTPKRKNSLRLKNYDYSNAGAYFVTLCTKNRLSIFGVLRGESVELNNSGIILEKQWKILKSRFPNIETDDYIIMPDHFHGIININPVGAIHESPGKNRRNMTLGKIIGYFKMNTAKEINLNKNTIGQQIWQKNYFEHVIRNDHDLNEIRDYIITNPSRWLLKHEKGDS